LNGSNTCLEALVQAQASMLESTPHGIENSQTYPLQINVRTI